MFAKELEKFDLNKGEAKVYSALLQFGDSSASQLAKHTGLGRTNIYEYANSLIKRGLASEFEKNNRIYYRAENPAQLQEIANKKMRSAKELSLTLTEMLPKLEELFNINSSKPSISFYAGKNGRKELFDKIFYDASLDSIYILVPDLDEYSLPEPKYRNTFQRNKVFTNLFANRGDILTEYQLRDEKEQRKTVLVPSSHFKITMDMLVVGDRVIFGSIEEADFSVTSIRSGELAGFLTGLLDYAQTPPGPGVSSNT